MLAFSNIYARFNEMYIDFKLEFLIFPSTNCTHTIKSETVYCIQCDRNSLKYLNLKSFIDACAFRCLNFVALPDSRLISSNAFFVFKKINDDDMMMAFLGMSVN